MKLQKDVTEVDCERLALKALNILKAAKLSGCPPVPGFAQFEANHSLLN